MITKQIVQKLCTLILFNSILVNSALSQADSLKAEALTAFQKEHYPEAVVLLEKALKESPDDAEIYYYLGWFNHYRAYDSRPLNGYDFSWSEKIFNYLDKAIELNPDYGDAKYFYGAECSGNAFQAMQDYDADKMKYFYSLANRKGAYPEWLKEFGRNFLSSCDENAILFAGGNADFDICSYLQLCENFRTDITVIPIGNIDRPWYVRFLKNGLDKAVRPVHLKLTGKQIDDIHPFKWRETEIPISVSETDKKQFSLSEDFKFRWTVYPDLISQRMHSKSSEEKAEKRSYLSPQRAILLQIVEDNFIKRPIFFSNFAESSFYGGLDKYFQNCGMVSKLLPIETKDSKYEMNQTKLKNILNEESLKSYSNITKTDIPRISGIVFSAYSYSFIYLANCYHQSEEIDKIRELISMYENHIMLGYNGEYEKMFKMSLEQIMGQKE